MKNDGDLAASKQNAVIITEVPKKTLPKKQKALRGGCILTISCTWISFDL